MEITDYHAKLFAHELTRQCASDEVDKLAPVLADAKVDLNPHQVEATLFAFQNQLFEHVEHVLPDRSEQDLLFEILLKDGFELTTPVETFEVRGFRVHSVAGGELLLCLQDKLTHELIQDLAERRPSRVVFLDRGFRDNDQLKANAAKLFASKAGENFKKFKTV